MNNLDLTDTFIFNFDLKDDTKQKEDEYVKSCSRKTKKKDLKELIEKITDYSTKKLDSTVDEVKKLLGL